MGFLEDIRRKVLLFDGAMGTEIHKLDLADDEWGEYPGCNEFLSVSSPGRIAEIYRSYLDAGSDLIETNTFGAQKITLEEHGLSHRTEELNKESARLARKIVDEYCSAHREEEHCRYVVGAMGPGTKLPSLGHIDFDTLHDSYYAQAKGLIEGGTDAFIVETAQDPLQIKAAVLAIRDAQKDAGLRLPVVVSVTIETNGTMLVGTDIAAAVTILEPLDIDVLGINCATGPAEMRPHIKELASLFKGPVFAMPNAGFPEHKEGRLVYDVDPENFADHLISFVEEYGVDVVGGCCGTDPSYIAELRRKLDSAHKAERRAETPAALASLYSRQELTQDPGPFFVAERTNTNGSKKFREYLLQENRQALEEMGKAQERQGAHGIDVSVAYAGRDEKSDMSDLIGRLRKSLDRPLVIDSTDPQVIEEALKLIGGRPLINSVNLEEGEERAGRLFALAARYGAAIIALTIDEEGMAQSLERKMSVARRIVEIGTKNHGLRPYDIVLDPLTFTLGSGEQSLKKAGFTTIEALERLKKEIPGVRTILGVSNISYGLAKHSREVLNSVFLHEAVKTGLDLAIVNVKKIIPLHSISEDDKKAALDLIYHRGGDDPLLSFINHFDATSDRNRGRESNEDENEFASLIPTERVHRLVVDGSSHRLEETLELLREEKAPELIISEDLIPAMKKVGDLFGEGEIQLPFVLQSAEVMKKAVDTLEPYMTHSDSEHKVKVILATVRGDVHDIGKNLVDIILSNNGYEVHNLGIKVDIDVIVDKAKEIGADAIGMSGLLVKSTAVMKENIEIMKDRGLDLPVLLGGAALTRKFVDSECAPLITSPIFYCKDAFDGLHALSSLELNTVETGKAGGSKAPDSENPDDKASAHKTAGGEISNSETAEERQNENSLSSDSSVVYEPLTLKRSSVPSPPDWDTYREENEETNLLFSAINTKRLIRGRWGYKTAFDQRRSKAPADLPESPSGVSKDEAWSFLSNLKAKIEKEELLEPKALYRWFPCRAEGDSLLIYDFDLAGDLSSEQASALPTGQHPDARGTEPVDNIQAIARLDFPRQEKFPRRCISDFFLYESAHMDKEHGEKAHRDREPTEQEADKSARTDRIVTEGGESTEAAKFFSSLAPDLVGLQIVTMGPKIGEAIAELFREDRYKEYLLLHGLAVELTEVYADIVHRRMEERLGLASPDLSTEQNTPSDLEAGRNKAPGLSTERSNAPELSTVGTRFSVGYPCCPRLGLNRTIAQLLSAEDIGVSFTEDDQMVPEFTTSAFISFHPEAHYFSV